nr:hypothetical protein [Tanacetum cinerariifolium]
MGFCGVRMNGLKGCDVYVSCSSRCKPNGAPVSVGLMVSGDDKGNGGDSTGSGGESKDIMSSNACLYRCW